MNLTDEKAKKIKLVLFDVDGVLTDGRLIFGDDGQEYKSFYARDGHGMRMLMDSGVEVGVITGRTSQVVTHRMQNLKVTHIYQGKREKLPALLTLLKKTKLQKEEVAFVGDDVMDIPVMIQVGFAIAVVNAEPIVKEYADWQTERPGGQGAARDVCDYIMHAQGTLQASIDRFTLNPPLGY